MNLLSVTCLLLIGTFAGCSTDNPAASRAAGLRVHRDRPRLTAPRIAPLERKDWTDAQRAYLEKHEQAGRLFNVFKTSARHLDLSKSIDALAFGHINDEASTLSARDRELLILRIGWLCKAEYEWAAHSRVARSIGFTDEELVRITEGPDAPGWTPFEATLLRAVDELHGDAFITDPTWHALSGQYSTQQLMDVVATVGTYNLVCMLLNSWGVQLDDGLTGFPDRD